MRIGQFLGWLFIVIALVTAGWELYVFFAGGAYMTHSLGQLWYTLDRASLNAAQAGIQRHVWPPLWDPVLITVLRAPAWPTFAVLGLGLAWLFRDRRRRTFRR